MEKLAGFLENKSILITGCCGTIGRELCKYIDTQNIQVKNIIGIDNNENGIANLQQQNKNKKFEYFLSDICYQEAIHPYFFGIDLVFHTAAFKHVSICETSPDSAVRTNIMGLQNVIMASISNDVKKVIFTSSDKAVNPTNVMGTSKLMGERLITAANSIKNNQKTIFASTRFGNVLGSNGSVVPIFQNQIEGNLPITLTDSNMTRFFMTIEDAAKLVLVSASIANGGEVFITKMPVIKIINLAKAMNEILMEDGYTEFQSDIHEIGANSGEKLYEELMTEEETSRAIELDHFFAVLPAFDGFYRHINYKYENIKNDKLKERYISRDIKDLKISQIKDFLRKSGVLNKSSEKIIKRTWPGYSNT